MAYLFVTNSPLDPASEKLLKSMLGGKTPDIYSLKQTNKSEASLSSFKKVLQSKNPSRIIFLGANAFNAVSDEQIVLSNVRCSEIIKNLFGTDYRCHVIYDMYTLKINPVLLSVARLDLVRIYDKEMASAKIVAGKHKILTTLPECKEYIEYLINDASGKLVAYDTETLNLNKRHGNKIATMQFSHNGKTGYVIPWDHKESPFSPDEKVKLKKYLGKLFTGPVSFSYWGMHNAKFDVTVTYTALGHYINNVPILDSRSGGFLLDENRLKGEGLSLEALLNEFGFSKYLGLPPSIKEARDGGSMFSLPLKDLAIYGARDAYVTHQLLRIQQKLAKLQNFEDQWLRQQVYYYSSISKLFSIMEYNGAYADLDFIRFLKTKDSPIVKRLAEIKKEVRESKACKDVNSYLLKTMNIDSSPSWLTNESPWVFSFDTMDHKRLLFFRKLKLEPMDYGKPDRTTVTDRFCRHRKTTTDPKFLSKQCNDCGAVMWGKLDKEFQEEYKHVKEVELFTEYNSLKKLATSYVNSLLGLLDPDDGEIDMSTDRRIRASNNYTGTATGRGSSSDPNLQNLPRSSDDNPHKKSIKSIFCAPKGKLLGQVDYATAEIRVWGIIAKDTGLAKIYNDAAEIERQYRLNPKDKSLKEAAKMLRDIHRQTAAKAFNTTPEKVEKKQRSAAKGVSFGVLYGQTDKALAEALGVEEKEATGIKTNFFKPFPKAGKWISEIHSLVDRKHWVESTLGLRRRLYLGLTGEDRLIERSRRQSVNSIIQGMSAQLAMLGCALVNDFIMQHKLNEKWGWLINNYVHDSLSFECYPEYFYAALLITEYLMSVGVMQYARENFGVEFTLPIAVDVEMGYKLGDMIEWDLTKSDFKKVFTELKLEDKVNFDLHGFEKYTVKLDKPYLQQIQENLDIYEEVAHA